MVLGSEEYILPSKIVARYTKPKLRTGTKNLGNIYSEGVEVAIGSSIPTNGSVEWPNSTNMLTF